MSKEFSDLVDWALAFRRAGGYLTLADWQGLETEQKAAFATAGTLYDLERDVRGGIASQGPQGAAQAMSEVDGGDTLENIALDAATEYAKMKYATAGGKGE